MNNVSVIRKSLTIISIHLLLLGVVAAFGQGVDTTYCCFPPFTWKTPTPNVLVIFDNSMSMGSRAYTTTEIIQGTPADTIKYYGYFDPDSNYTFQTTGGFTGWFSSPTGQYPGRILNWAIMSRGDVAKKVMIGGRGPSTWAAASDPVRLEGEGRLEYSVYYRSSSSPSSNYSRIDVTHDPTSLTFVSVTRVGTGPLPSIGSSVVWVYIPRSKWGGVLARIADKNDDGIWDDNCPRFGVATFNYGPGGLWEGYDELSGAFADNGSYITGGTGYIGDVTYTAYYQAIRNVIFSTWTPLGEAYWEMLRYYSQAQPFYANADYNASPVAPKDPYYDKSLPGPAQWGKMTPCRESFMLVITDGASTKDLHVPNSVIDMPNANDLRSYATYSGSGVPAGPNITTYTDQGSNYLIHLAYYGNITDLRPDTLPAGDWWIDRNLPDRQNVALFGIAAFEESALLRDACKFGGFVDNNDNKKPDLQIEWDADFDGVPDNYFFARDGQAFERALEKAILMMIARSQSASPVAVVSTGTRTGGIAVQSQFYQVRLFPENEMLDWIGTTHSLWLDPFGLLREDTQADAILDLQNDHVITMLSYTTGVTLIRYQDVYGNGQVLDSIEAVPIDSLRPVWDGGEWLWNRLPADRTVKTFIDANKNSTVDPGEFIDFTSAHASALRPHLGALTDGEADTLIQFIRGQDFPDYRTRTVDGKVWKLGDVINSGPTLIGRPVERYDFIYGDASYALYYNYYRNRRQVVYVGGNDGMLHCFNSGFAQRIDNALTPMGLDPGGYDLGAELWGYIPYNLLPHLKWLRGIGYEHCHNYYVDLRAYVTDAQLFDNANPKYPGGWGTVLIGGMRLGGLPITTQGDTCSSSFFMIDVTDPIDPVPMWEYSPLDLALTTCFSTVVKVGSAWFLVFGSGPQSCSGESGQNARIFILDLKTGALLRKITLADDPSSFISNIFACDWGIDYTVDRIYFGDAYYAPAPDKAWRGKVYRILTNDDPDPNNWTLEMIMNTQRPITAEGTVATDEYNHLWVYFGTGRLYSEFDVADTTTEHLYVGFRDDTVHSTNYANLYNVTDVQVDTLDQVHLAGGGIVEFDSLVTLVNNRLGWYRWLTWPGERCLTSSLVIGGATLFTTFRPGLDICSYGGTGELYALYYLTGTAYTEPFLGSTGNTNNVSVNLGAGMPSEPSLYVTADQTKVFVQVGGVIVSPETGIPGLPRSGVILWKGR